MYTLDINRTHIIVLQEVDGVFRNTNVPIIRPEHFIAELQAMKGNSNRTVWDMQSLFTSRFPKGDSYLDYIHPHSYDSTYVNGIRYPRLMGFDELEKSWLEEGRSAREIYLERCRQEDKNPDPTIAKQEETTAIENLKCRQKYNFFNDAMRWIDASCYNETVSQLKCNGTFKMYSKENIGWNNFTYPINDDIKIALKTNFGFGSASYFLMAVQYKGIDIIPYSYIVKYYKARMADIVRCTRSYNPCRESWQASFDFISDFVNQSIADPKGFVESYIMREVTEMMQGLEAIAINPKVFIERIESRQADPCVINVRPMFGDDKVRMQTYPEETPILFKVEKITGALEFLKSLIAISKEVKTVQPHIDRLLEINMALYPEVQDAIAKISKKVAQQTLVKTNLETQVSEISEKLAPYEEELSQLRSSATREHPFDMGRYESTHSEFVNL